MDKILDSSLIVQNHKRKLDYDSNVIWKNNSEHRILYTVQLNQLRKFSYKLAFTYALSEKKKKKNFLNEDLFQQK